MHYRAFISHSHADAKFAAWLQRAIETWRVPTRLRADLGYSRIKPIFRDRTDLRAAKNLGDALEDALAHSAALIVVCSNDAADSEWVDQEISRFREINPDAPILPIIAAGEPPHCFPESLLVDADGNALEPLAADARKGFDGKRDALLKTIAGLIDVDFDVLKQRDFRRRQQKMGAVAALSTAIAAVTLYLAYVAYEARDDANRRREQADDLIAFMLGDLREKLEPIGKLDVLDAVGDEALDYFAGFDVEDLTREVALKNAIALRQLGEVEVAKSRYSKALEAFGEAEEILNSLDHEYFQSAEVGEQRYLIDYWVGYVYHERSEWDKARVRWVSYHDLSRSTFESSGDHAHKIEYLYSKQNLGVLELNAGNLDEASQYLAEALAELDKGTYYDPATTEYKDAKSTLLSWSGEVAWLRGDLPDALSLYRAELELTSELREAEENMLYDELELQALSRVALVNLVSGAVREASSMYETAYTSSRRLVEFDPENAYWLRLFTRSALGYSRVLHASGEVSDAMGVAREADSKAAVLYAQNPNSAKNAAQLVALRLQMSALELCDQNPNSAGEHISSAKSVLDEIGTSLPQDEILNSRLLLNLYAADAASAFGNSTLAMNYINSAAEMLENNSQRLDPVEAILSNSRLGHHKASREGQ